MIWFTSSQGNGHYATAICPTGYQNNFPICGLWHRLMNSNLFSHRIVVTQCAPNHFHWTNCNKSLHLFHFMPLVDPRGCWGRASPFRSNFFYFHAVFGEKLMTTRTPSELASALCEIIAPPLHAFCLLCMTKDSRFTKESLVQLKESLVQL